MGCVESYAAETVSPPKYLPQNFDWELDIVHNIPIVEFSADYPVGFI